MIQLKGLILSCLIIISNSLISQDLSEYQLLAHYPLVGTNGDITGNNDTLLLLNAPFLDQEGIFSNGIYHNVDPAGSILETPNINGVNLEHVAMSIDFKLTDSLVNEHAILIEGRSWRWLGAGVDADNQLQLIINGISYDAGSFLIRDQWYHLSLKYQIIDSTASIYLDDSLIFMSKKELVTDPNDKIFTNYHGGDGHTFEGNLRHLKIYGPRQSKDWFADDIAWTYRWNVLGGFGYEELHVLGDTFVLDQPCKIVQPIIVTSRDPFIMSDTVWRDAYYMYESNDSVFYFFHSIFSLIYNFSMEPGDSINYPALVSGPEFSCPPGTFILDSVRVVNVDGIPLRQQYGKIRIDRILDESQTYLITERIGFTHKAQIANQTSGVLTKFGHLIPENAFTCLIDADAWQFCSYESLDLNYNPGNEDCKDDLILPAIELEHDDILISPNPSDGWVNINSGIHKIRNVKIYTCSGQLLANLPKAHDRIQLPDKHGIYFLQIFTSNGMKAFKVVRD